MRQSQVMLLSGFGVVALGMIVSAGVARVALSQAAFDGGEGRRGPGPQVTRSFDLEGFSGVDASDVWNVTVTQGAEWNVEVSFPANFEDALIVRVDGERLVLGRRGLWFGGWGDNDERFRARISMPELASIDVSGAARVEFAGFDGDRLTVDLSGAGFVAGRDGAYDRVDIDSSGAGHVDLRDITVMDADMDISGAAQVELNMNGGTLAGDISGAGRVLYYGTVTRQQVDVSGAGRVAPGD